MRKIISTHKFFAPTRKDPNHDLIFVDRSQLRDLLFSDKKAGHAIDFGQNIKSWLGFFGSALSCASFGGSFEAGLFEKKVKNAIC